MINYLLNNKKYTITGDGIFVNKIKKSSHQNSELYETVGGTQLFERCRVPGTLSFFDFEIVKAKVFSNINFNDKVILDLGCGDGRFTYEFLKNPKTKVICVDSNYESLLRLKKNIKIAFDDTRVILLNEDILNLPRFSEKVDIVWAFESLYYLDSDYKKGINIVCKLIKEGGILLNAERNNFGGLVHSLLNGRLDHFFEAIKKNKIYDYFGDTELKTSSFDDSQIKDILSINGLILKNKYRLPIINTFLSFLISNKIFDYDEIRKNSQKLLKELIKMNLSEDNSRITIYESEKRK